MSGARIKPGPWQVKSWHAALTALAVVVLVGVCVGALWIVVEAAAFLQPLLIPIVAAIVLTYLLTPVVDRFCAFGLSRTWAVLLLFLLIGLGFGGIGLYIGPILWHQTTQFGQTLPDQASRGQELLLSTLGWLKDLQQRFQPVAVPADERTVTDQLWAVAGGYIQDLIVWFQQKLPQILSTLGGFLQRSAGGFLGVAGVVVSLALVPLFLFFFLKDSDSLARDWRKYIPLPESPLKDEVASLVEEINGYLLRYFRGQFMVSLIDGALIGTALLIMGLNFGLLIGLAVGILGMIPYLGMLICWIPAVLIAIAQYGDWTHPIIVTVIFLAMNNLEGFLIAPRIVGDSVSLRPFTVIMSVLIWSLVLGGLLGALLAVPLTATLKVLLQRYVWRRQL